jgi:hypothetical protein
MIHMFDAAFNMLGPDVETHTEILTDLGERHIVYGVKPHYFRSWGKQWFMPSMRQSENT